MSKKVREEAAARLAEDTRAMTPWQIRQRLRRGTQDPEEARIAMGGKPVDEWDHEELARGRPRNSAGNFGGAIPAWVTEDVQEEAHRRFKQWLKREMSRHSITALETVADLVGDADTDRVRLDASKFLLEHVVGKPQQDIKGDVQVKLAGLLAGVIVNPGEDPDELYAEVIDDEDDDWSEDEDLDDD